MDGTNDNQNNQEINDLTAEQQAALENMTNDELLDVFAEEMMRERGLGDLDEESFKMLKDDLRQRVAFQINRAILAQLPEDKLNELGAGLESGVVTSEQFDELIKTYNIDVEKTTEDTLMTFREAYVGAKAEA